MSLPVLDADHWGFGAAGIGSLAVPVSDAIALATVDAAWNAGVRYFDTAPHYGLGLSERRLGAALAGRDRDGFTVSTKVGRLLVDSGVEQDDLAEGGFAVRSRLRRVFDFSEEGITRSLADSRRRLGLDRIDIAFLHDPEEHDLRLGIDTALPALARSRDSGELGRVGVGSKSVQALLAAVRSGIPDVIMLAGRYTLLDRSAAEELLPACLERGIDVIAVGVFNSGALSRDEPVASLPYEYGPMPAAVFARLSRIAAVCRHHGVPLPVAALRFPLRHPAISGIAIGAQSPDQVRQNHSRFAARVPEGLWHDLESEGLP